MLKKFKQATLRSLKTTGVSKLVHNSNWRRQRLVILTYHGIAMDDEHLWDNSMFMSPELFRSRLELIKRSGCTVLPLDEAIKRLYENDLPERAVVITFDDGLSDFQEKAFPLIREFDFPVTLYLTTFYSEFNRPVFDLMCAYLLWKGRNETLNLKDLTGREDRLELGSEASRESARIQLLEYASAEKLSAEEKDKLAASLAETLRVDYAALLERRALHLVTPDQVRQLAADGVDIQLHTHRHRTPLDRDLFMREIEDNRKSIQATTGTRASHFCYPSGKYNLALLPWLKEAGVLSATTCEQGMASPSSNPLLLPRLIDVSTWSSIEFESWLTGISAALPRRGPTERAHVGDTS